jgi:hypothetical protein
VEKPNQVVLGRDRVFQRGRLDGLEQAIHLTAVQAGGIHQQDDVGGRGGALGLQPRQDAGVVGVDTVDPDPSGLGEVAVQRLVGRVVAGGIQVEHLFLREGRGCGGGQGQHGGQDLAVHRVGSGGKRFGNAPDHNSNANHS